MHLHSHLIQTAELYGRGVLGIQHSDVVYSAAKLFCWLGKSVLPMAVGALRCCCGQINAYGCFHHSQDFDHHFLQLYPPVHNWRIGQPAKSDVALRICTSAGEALPDRQTILPQPGSEVLDSVARRRCCTSF
jgi:benzoate-CoA ligase